MQASLHWFPQRSGFPPVHKDRIAMARRKLHQRLLCCGLILPLPALRITSPLQHRDTSRWLHRLPQHTGQGQNQQEMGMHLAGALKSSRAGVSLPSCGHQFTGLWGKAFPSISIDSSLGFYCEAGRKEELNLCSWYHSAFYMPLVKL